MPCYFIDTSGNAVRIPLSIIASNPYFLDTDQPVRAGVDELTPDEILHRSYMDIEPTTDSKKLS
jgi:hypothetical protein